MGIACSTAHAHFIWVVSEPAENPTVAKVYLSEEAGPDDPELLSHIAAAKTYIPVRRGDPKVIELKVDGDALVGEIPEKNAESPIVVNQEYGVMARGPRPFLIHYYAKTYPSELPGTWRAVNKPDILPLEIVPALDGDTLTFTVNWEGKPLPGAQVTVEGPGIYEKTQGDTDENGKYVAKVDQGGLFSIRARYEQDAVGEHDGKKYDQVKHYSTLSLRLSPQTAKTVNDSYPQLEQGTTSFGGAVVGDHLYVYGGNHGNAHGYSEEEQSNLFQRLDLKNPTAWERLPSGPRRTGLAMVAHNGKLYRVGGFEVQGDGDKNLSSMNDFARFDPAVGAWEDLTPLPEARSSHDVVVIGDTLYVAGGWTMVAGGETETVWLKPVYACDLTQPTIEWKHVTDLPAERRAISMATRDGLLYFIGGMQPSNGATTKVDIFDPATQTWTQGPSLRGETMDGFGTASFGVDGQLITTTMSGSIQRLSADGSKWEVIGKMQNPRFFHEIAPWNHNLVIVGGASMETGKVDELERLPVQETQDDEKKAALAE